SMQGADCIWLHQPADIGWSLREEMQGCEVPVVIEDSIAAITADVVRKARSGDHILVMSNGAFGGIHDKLLKALQAG
ncbi:MAG: UDP-N-acetylmuramate:L-alanyl-gamma-D-glutamyl-meso-diaminopimelate ligase, partial [Gammaproteobacteria bacterium]